MMLRYLWLMVCLATATVQAQTPLEAFVTDTRTLDAGFTQKLFDETGMLIEESRGTFHLKRPHRFRWEYLEPYRQLIVANGKQIWVYEADLEQATLKSLDEALENTPVSILSGRRPLAELFTITTGADDDPAVQVFRLTPKQEDGQFRHVLLTLRGSLLLRLTLEDNLGQTTQVEFQRQQRNIAIDDKLFDFTLPDGVDLIDGRE